MKGGRREAGRGRALHAQALRPHHPPSKDGPWGQQTIVCRSEAKLQSRVQSAKREVSCINTHTHTCIYLYMSIF